jgi:hypothetical protein
MRWHRCHLFKEAFDLKPMCGSRDKMRLVPLNAPGDTKIDPQVCLPKKKRCGAPLPTALQKTFFGLRRQSKATTALFPHALTPEGEKHGAFVQVLPVQNG